MEHTKKIWFNGEFHEDIKIEILTHALHYGSGVFEGIRAYETKYGPAVFRLHDHIKRFFYSASCLEMKIPFSKEEIENAIPNLIKMNNLKECYIRPIAFYGYGEMGLNPNNCPVNVGIIAWPWGAYLSGKEVVDVKISKYMRLHPKSIISDAKICGYYINSILASLDAKSSGFDEAVLLDFEGNIAEGPGENIFIVKNGKLFTPKKGSILCGITRDTVIKIAKEFNIQTEEKTITVEELKSAEEVFFTGTAVEIQGIGKIDEKIINNHKIGKITKKIKDKYYKIVRGGEEKYLEYLSFV
ncbi:MAG: branched chain amino acid aminotransferase [Candidatus Aenigmarchaeota archaeon ex4484_56]|nr:MAG: branched chain amino acid aminotransferase [Candidatus Aenigmarchaeota archaeon ex4484_56]